MCLPVKKETLRPVKGDLQFIVKRFSEKHVGRRSLSFFIILGILALNIKACKNQSKTYVLMYKLII